jgi:translation initiation factor IF-3
LIAKKQYWRVNNNIRASEVRVLGSDNKQIGVMKVSDALKKAKSEKLDLIEIAPKAKPPVVKIADFGKFKYQEEKKAKKQAKLTKASELKEIRFSPFIGESDYQTRLERIREFLEDKNKVRIVIKFKGRQMGSKKFGYDLMKRILAEFEEEVQVDMQPKFMGRHLVMVISPLSSSKRVEKAKIEIKKEIKYAKT